MFAIRVSHTMNYLLSRVNEQMSMEGISAYEILNIRLSLDGPSEAEVKIRANGEVFSRKFSDL